MCALSLFVSEVQRSAGGREAGTVPEAHLGQILHAADLKCVPAAVAAALWRARGARCGLGSGECSTTVANC